VGKNPLPICSSSEYILIEDLQDNQIEKFMTGKKVIITGPTSGIGKEIAIQLASLGAEVILACRNLQRGKQTAEEITNLTGNQKIAVMFIDTSSQQSIRQFVREFKEKYSQLDVLVNNAGIYTLHWHTNSDGLELTFATNVLGYFILTNELLDILKASAPARIVNVASTFASPPDFNDLQFEHRKYKGHIAYSQSKACNRMLTWALTRRLEHSGVTANAMAPGFVLTELYRDMPPSAHDFLFFLGRLFGRSVTKGADTAVWLASSPETKDVNGKFFKSRKEIPCKFRNTKAEERLWVICEGLGKKQ
jgi:NAD(P)-dependent dehydrogenase (short-subunit alcohol dehydrogenase family)